MTKKLFPTLIYESKLSAKIKQSLNKQLLKEISVYQETDDAGHAWSKENYRGGYTSYNSITNFHQLSPTFEELQKYLDQHVKKFAKELNYDLRGRKLAMTTCWVNVMPQNTYHPLHIHPLCTISGTYYVKVPNKTSSLKIEDTKMAFLMSSPPRKDDNYYYYFKPTAGDLIMFESWVRHEVPPNPAKENRISISFNYEWI
jgi:uncharacterized protein (TIGR02466 family)